MEPGAGKYLGAKIEGRTYVSNVLPFGLSLSPYVFTRLTNWIAGVIRKETGMKAAVYIDDFLLGSETKEQLEQGVEKVRKIFENLGVMLSSKKTTEVKEEVEFLGFLWSAKRKTVGITPERRKEYKRIVKNLLRTAQPVSRWKTIIGKLLFLREAIGPTLRHVRSLLRAIRGKRLTERITPTGEAELDLRWWMEILSAPRELGLTTKGASASITTDASDSGIGYVVELDG